VAGDLLEWCLRGNPVGPLGSFVLGAGALSDLWGHPMSAQSVFVAAETKLLKDKRTYAKKVLGLLVEHLHLHHPEAVRLSVYADQHVGAYFVGELLDSHGEVIGFDASVLVVPCFQVEGPFGEELTVGPHAVADLFHRALSTYEGPLEKVLGVDRVTGEHYLPLRRPS